MISIWFDLKKFFFNIKTFHIAYFRKNSTNVVGDTLGERKLIVCAYYFKCDSHKLLNFFWKTCKSGIRFDMYETFAAKIVLLTEPLELSFL